MKNKIEMVFGDENTIFKNFDVDEYPEHEEYLNENDGKVGLTYVAFACEWAELVDYDESYGYIDNGKLYVIVYGIPEHINEEAVKKYYSKTLEQYIEEEFGEFFETEPHCSICMIVERNGVDVTV